MWLEISLTSFGARRLHVLVFVRLIPSVAHVVPTQYVSDAVCHPYSRRLVLLLGFGDPKVGNKTGDILLSILAALLLFWRD